MYLFKGREIRMEHCLSKWEFLWLTILLNSTILNLQRTAGVDYAQASHLVLLYTFLSFTPFCVLPLVSSRMADDARDILWKMFTVFRSSRRNQQPNSRFAISEGPLAYMGSILPNPLDTSHSYLEALVNHHLLFCNLNNFISHFLCADLNSNLSSYFLKCTGE